MKEDWSNKLKQRMESHEMDAPAGLWQNIESGLQSAQVANTRRRGALVWMSRAAAAAAVVGVVALAVWMSRDNATLAPAPDMASRQDQEAPASPKIEESIIPDDMADNAIVEKVQRLTVSTADKRDSMAEVADTASVASEAQEVNIAEHRMAEKSDEKAENAPNQNKPATRAAETQPQPAQQQTLMAQNSDSWADFNISKPRKNRWSTSLYASSSSGERTKTATPLLMDASSSFMGVQNGVPLQTISGTPKLTHNLPGEVGFRVRFGITDRVFVESGVGYAYLTSDYANDVMKRKQTLHYIGVPVNVGYTFWRRGIFAAYASVGAKGEKLVSGELKNEYLSTPPVVEKESISEKQLQWSIEGTLGIEMNLVKHLSLFAEPGVVHRFDNGSDVENVYKERPTDFSLRVGLRITK